MAPSEARLVINRSPDDPAKAGQPGKMAAATASAAAVREQIDSRRKKIFDQAKIDRSGSGIKDEPVDPGPPPPVREDLESIEFTAPNGMTIEYGPRHDISLVDRIARMYNGRDPTVSEFRLTRILMGIRTINGAPPQTIVDEITRTALANRIGDENIDLLMYYDRLHWPPLQQSELPIVRKRSRT